MNISGIFVIMKRHLLPTAAPNTIKKINAKKFLNSKLTQRKYNTNIITKSPAEANIEYDGIDPK